MSNKKKKRQPEMEPDQSPIENEDMDKKGCKKPDTGTLAAEDEEGSGGGNPPPDKPRDN